MNPEREKTVYHVEPMIPTFPVTNKASFTVQAFILTGARQNSDSGLQTDRLNGPSNITSIFGQKS